MGIMGTEQKPWGYAEDVTLREMWLTHSATQIAKRLQGRSSNAVIGRGMRLKMPAKGVKPSAPKQGLPHASQRSKTQHPARLAGKSAEAISRPDATSPIGDLRETELHRACSAGKNVWAIHVRRDSSQAAADTGAGTAPPARPPAPVPFAPRNPKPWIEATGCQYHVEMSRFLEPGEHMAMLVCDEPLAGHARYSRYCEHHVPKHVERVA